VPSWGGARRPLAREQSRQGAGNGVGRKRVGVSTRLLDRLVKEGPRRRGCYAAFQDLGEPQQGCRPSFVRYPKMPHNHAFSGHQRGDQAGLFEVISTSSQPINSVAVANGYSLLMALKLPPKKSRTTKTAWFGRFDFTSSE